MIVLILLLILRGGEETLSSARTHLGNGQKLMETERFREAADEFEQAMVQMPSLAKAREQLAICYFELREYRQARQLFIKMRGLNENSTLVNYYLGRVDLIEQDFEEAVKHFRLLSSSPFRDELYYLGVAYFKEGKFSEALSVLTRAASDNPRDYRIHQLLGRTYQKLGENKKAEQAFAETQRLHDYYLQGSVAIAECRSLLLAGKTAEAWERGRTLLETDDVDKLVGLGMVFGKSGEYGPALEIWKRALKLDPDSPEINYNLALTTYHLKNLPQARQSAATALELRPDFFEANMLYGTILYLTAQDEAAIRVLTHAHELRPDDGETRKLLSHQLLLSSEALVKKKDFRQAIDRLEQAATLSPDSQEIADKLAQTRALLRRQ